MYILHYSNGLCIILDKSLFTASDTNLFINQPIKHILGDNTDSISKRTHVSAKKCQNLSPQLMAEKSKTPQSNFHHFLKKVMFSKNLKNTGQFTAKTISLSVYPPMTYLASFINDSLSAAKWFQYCG